jgi:hypothetical protein
MGDPSTLALLDSGGVKGVRTMGPTLAKYEIVGPSGAMTLTRVPLAGNIGGLAFGPDGNLWLTFYDLGVIGRLAVSG